MILISDHSFTSSLLKPSPNDLLDPFGTWWPSGWKLCPGQHFRGSSGNPLSKPWLPFLPSPNLIFLDCINHLEAVGLGLPHYTIFLTIEWGVWQMILLMIGLGAHVSTNPKRICWSLWSPIRSKTAINLSSATAVLHTQD